jgi:hypothetical protein
LFNTQYERLVAFNAEAAWENEDTWQQYEWQRDEMAGHAKLDRLA